jgi:hypothetical protein
MDPVLVYHDDVTRLLSELQAYLAQHPEAVLLGTERCPFPGLPVIPDDAPSVYRNYRHYVKTPWGQATFANIRYAHYPTLSYAGLLTLVEPAPDVTLPRFSVPDVATAVVNPITGLTAVFAGDGLSDNVTLGQATWEGKLSLPDRWREPDVLHAVRLALARAHVPLLPGTLFAERVPYPWLTPEGLPAAMVTIANGEVCLPVIGYAVDGDTDEVVYLSLVGHKTATRSIWGSLNTIHQRKLTLETGRSCMTVVSSHTYATYTDVVDADTGLLRMQIVDRRAFAPDVAARAYLIAPSGLAAADVHAAFAARLRSWTRCSTPPGRPRGCGASRCRCSGSTRPTTTTWTARS